MQVVTDHTAMKSVLLNPAASGKHARWWAKVFESGISDVDICYRKGCENSNADALSRAPCGEPPVNEGTLEVTVFHTQECQDIRQLLQSESVDMSNVCSSLGEEQRKDPQLREMIAFVEKGVLPSDEPRARKLALQANQFAVIDGILYFVDSTRGQQRRAVVPKHLRTTLLELNHSGSLSGRLSGPRLCKALASSFWWQGMYKDAVNYFRSCPQCVTVTGRGQVGKPPLKTIPVEGPFQVIGVDIMDLPKTESGNKHVLVFQDFFI